MAVTQGSIGFVGINTNGVDWLAFVTLADLAAGDTIYFTDNELTTASATSFNTGESYSKWVAPVGGVVAGTVVVLNAFDSATPAATTGTASVVTFTGSTNRGLSATAESVYAYTAASDATADTPVINLAHVFIGVPAAPATDGVAPSGLPANLDLSFTDGRDGALFTGSHSNQTSLAGYLTPLSNTANYTNPGAVTTLSSALNATPFIARTVTMLSAGDADRDSAVLIAKDSGAGTMTFQVATDAAFNTIIVNQQVAVTDPLTPAKLALANGALSAGTQYFWRATDDAGATASASFRTADADGVRNGFSMGVTGDWRGELAPYPAVKNAATAGLDLFVKLGDTIYADYATPAVNIPQATTLTDYLTKHAEVYTPKAGLDAWGDLQKTTAVLSMIDDHEVTNDFAGGAPASTDARFNTTTGLINDTPLYENGLTAFLAYNAIEDRTYADTGLAPVTDGEKNLYRYSQQGRDAAVYMLDARSFRDTELAPASSLTDPTAITNFLVASANPARTLLGAAQLSQLKTDLLDAQAKGTIWKFIQLPEPIQNFGVLGASDRYEGYSAERTDILKFIKTNDITGVVFVSADIHGSVTNNLTYQDAPGGPQIATSAWEITTGSVAFDAPFGQTVDALAVAAGLLTPQQQAFYNSLPVAPDTDSVANDKDDFIKGVINQQVTALGYDPIGLNANLSQTKGLIDATLVSGDYMVTHSYGWTKFDVDATTGNLTVTTYGVPYYSAADAAANPAAIAALTPTVQAQFTVRATINQTLTGTDAGESITGSAGNDTINALGGDDTIAGGFGNDVINGGAGSDVVIFDGTRAAATIARTGPGAWTVTTANGGTDTLTGVEQIKFSDSSLYTTDQTAYIVSGQGNVHFTSILSAGDVAGTKADNTPWRMAGIPDGLGAFDNGDGTITVLMNQEIGNTLGIVRADGSKGAFVSKLIIEKATMSVVSGSDADTQKFLWNSTTQQYDLSTTALSRFCSADLAPTTAYYNPATGLGTQDRIFLNGEESGAEGRPMAHIITGVDAGRAYELPKFGNFGFENLVANGFTGDKTVVMSMDDTSPRGEVYFYIGTKQATGSTLDKAGLTNGSLYGIKADFASEQVTGATTPLSGTFTLAVLPDETNRTGAQLQTDSTAAGVTQWLRPEDGAWDTVNHNRFYFVTTDAINAPSRLWALDFVDPTDPSKGGTYKALLDGTEGQQMFDNITVSADGTLVLLEDPGNYQGAAKIWHYDPNTDVLVEMARHDVARFGDIGTPNIPPTAPFTIDEESSGVIDVTSLLGSATTRTFLIDTQAHYAFTGPNAAEVVEGGQLQLMTIDTVLNGTNAAESLTGSFIGEAINGLGGDDTIAGGGGADSIDGGAGNDTVTFSGIQSQYRFGLRDGVMVVNGPDGADQLSNVELVKFGAAAAVSIASLQGSQGDGGLVYANIGGKTGYVLPDAYTGPVAGIVNQLLGGGTSDVVLGTDKADFINGLAGDDAIDGGAGNDVIDGGLGSNFLSGGAGIDQFFIDGRGAASATTWSTITDWQAGESLTIFGYKPGVSVFLALPSDGATGYTGATLHADLDGNGTIDTSVTWAGVTQAQLPTMQLGADYVFFG